MKAYKNIYHPDPVIENRDVINATVAPQDLSVRSMYDAAAPRPQKTRKPMHNDRPAQAQRRERLTYGLLTILMVCGLALRLWNLDYLNYWGDENITALAIHGIVEHGYPQLPSGMIYFRSLPTTYLAALFTALFGENQLALRLPSVLFSLGTIFFIYRLGRRVFSNTVGLAAAFMLTFSYWDLEFARHARMYAPFAFFFSLSMYAVYRGVIEDNHQWFRLSLPIAAGTVLVHELGGVVALLYIVLAARPQPRNPSRADLLAAAAFLILLAGIQFFIVQFGFTIPMQLYEAATGRAPSLLNSIGQIASFLQFPPVLSPLSSWPGLLLASLAVVLLGCFIFSKRANGQFWTRSTLVSMLLMLAIHQLLLAGLILFVYLLFSGKGVRSFTRLEAWMIASLFLLAFGFWTTYGLYHWTDRTVPLVHRLMETLKIEAGLPKLYYICFLASFPLMALVTGAGLLRLFYRSLQPPPHNMNNRRDKAFFIFTGFVMPLLATGFVKTDWMEYRLNFHLNPLFVLFFVFTVAEILRGTQQWLIRQGLARGWRLSALLILGLALLGCGEQIYPQRVYHLITRNYGDPVDPRSAPGSHFRLMPDHELPGAYVKRQRISSDIVIAMDWLAQHNYTGRIDYWLRTDAFKLQAYCRDQKYFDIYTGAQIISSVEELRRIIAARETRRIWIITASAYTETQLHVTNEMLDFLKSLNQYVVFQGRDAKSLVYLLPEQSQK